MVSEAEWFAAYPRLQRLVGTDGTSPEAYLNTMRLAAARGVVGVVDLEFDQAVEEWPERTAAGAELLRVRVGAYVDTLDAFLAAGLRTGQQMPGCSHLVTMGPLKVISDGSLNTHDGVVQHAVPRRQQRRGQHHRRRAARGDGGRQPARPDRGHPRDRGRGGGPGAHRLRADRRHGLDRARPADPARRTPSGWPLPGSGPACSPRTCVDDRDLTERLWPDKCDRCFALRWLADEGVELALGLGRARGPARPVAGRRGRRAPLASTAARRGTPSSH